MHCTKDRKNKLSIETMELIAKIRRLRHKLIKFEIYNYEPTLRKEKKEVSSFFSGIFGNENLFAGTKIPERLVSDILAI